MLWAPEFVCREYLAMYITTMEQPPPSMKERVKIFIDLLWLILATKLFFSFFIAKMA